eukprot:TRINITY_DN9272_c1_g1_i4.p1 TRINITY_DN9272_c1_g1~~TRINITY_DN9272_c1_g1_i4.p1  ORF type:complete len:303 (-),score=28.21 TRINITY_DN9272_c1_g1_i4:196-1104(-)
MDTNINFLGGDVWANFDDGDFDTSVPDVSELIQKLKSSNENDALKNCIQEISKLDWQLEVMINDEKFPELCITVYDILTKGIEGTLEVLEKLMAELTGNMWGDVLAQSLVSFVTKLPKLAACQYQNGLQFLVKSLLQVSDHWVLINLPTQRNLGRAIAGLIDAIFQNKDFASKVQELDPSLIFWQRSASRTPVLRSIVENIDDSLVEKINTVAKDNAQKNCSAGLLICIYLLVGIYWYGTNEQKFEIKATLQQNQGENSLQDQQSLLRLLKSYMQQLDFNENDAGFEDIAYLVNWVQNLEEI